MTITLDQFRTAFPAASAATLAALFARDANLTPTLERILTVHGITEPHVAAHFLMACGLASDGFTKLDQPVFGLDAPEWVAARAREWEAAKLSEEANDWETDFVIQNLPDSFALPNNWPAIWRVLDAVCAALGVEQPSEEEEDVPLDRGASEM